MSLSCIIISRALLVHRSLLRVVSVFSGLVWSPSIICLNVLCVILCRESQRTVLQSASWRGCEYSTWSDSCVFMFNISSTEPVGVRNTLFFFTVKYCYITMYYMASAICFTDISYAAWKRTRKPFFINVIIPNGFLLFCWAIMDLTAGQNPAALYRQNGSRENIWSLVKRSHLVTCQKWKWLSLHSRKLIYSSLMMLNKLYGVCMI